MKILEKWEKNGAKNAAENYTQEGKTCALSGSFVQTSPHVTSPYDSLGPLPTLYHSAQLSMARHNSLLLPRTPSQTPTSSLRLPLPRTGVQLPTTPAQTPTNSLLAILCLVQIRCTGRTLQNAFIAKSFKSKAHIW